MDIAAVIGLGNPGEEYAATRHNMGFRVVDELAARWRLTRWRRRRASLVVQRRGARPVALAKPQTFMNLSGQAVAELCRSLAIEPPQCLVVVDDVDLPLGELRLRQRGGPGSHNGLRSIVDTLGEEFPRLRLGIRGARAWHDLADYVLDPFEDDELELVVTTVRHAADCVASALHEGIARAANRFNGPVESRGEGRGERGEPPPSAQGPGVGGQGPGSGEPD
jgi:PTH1 family peptidyl-tRNA hydrolase